MQRLASDEKGWIKIMIELINRIELDDPIGPPIISLFLDEFPIPTPVRNIVVVFLECFNLFTFIL
jgi:hypothetical protein